MSKRYEPINDFSRANKKLKTENVTKARPPPYPAVAQDLVDLWNDDDDDVILLASQAAEGMVANESQITFSAFAPGLQSSTSTSTQKPVESLRWNEKNNGSPSSTNGKYIPGPPTFQLAAEVKKTTSVSSINSKGIAPSVGPQSTMSRREKAVECQVKFLQNSLDKLREENAKLIRDLEETKTKMISKDGEVTILRDEIRHLKKQIQEIRVEKIHTTEETKTQCMNKIAQLSKEVQAKQTALELKSVEFNKMKMRFADESIRFEMSTRDISYEAQAVPPASNSLRPHQLRSLMRLTNLSLKDNIPMCHDSSKVQALPKDIFEQSIERGTSKIHKNLFEIELENLQTITAQYRSSNKNCTLSIDSMNDIFEKTLKSVRKLFAEFRIYVNSLEFNRNGQTHQMTSENDKNDSKRKNLFQVSELFDREKAINLRRYIALLSEICYTFPKLSNILLSDKHEDYHLIQIIVDAFKRISLSREIPQHFGVLESFSTLLHSLMLQNHNCETYEEQLIGILKALIYCQPNAWVLLDISRCFLLLVESEKLCTHICVNSPTEQQLNGEISSDSCLMQIYCSLLDGTFPSDNDLSEKRFQLLTNICYNYISFVNLLFTTPPKFIQDMIPNDEINEDENGGGGVGEQMENVCECYVKMCKTVLALLFKVLYYWQKTNCLSELCKIEHITKIGVKLMHRIFCQNDLARLFRNGEDTTRHYFDLISKCWSKYADLLQISSSHNIFLEKLLTSSFIQTKLANMGSKSVCEYDLSQWYQLFPPDNYNNNNQKRSKIDGSVAAANLKLYENATDPTNFFAGLKREGCNFE